MAFMKRSKSQKAKEVKELTPLPPLPDHEAQRQAQPEPEDLEAKKDRRKSRFERRKSIFGRSRSATDTRKSIQLERPRTADQSVPPPFGEHRGLQSHLSAIGETIAIQSGGDTFNFPTPSPRLPPPSRDRSSTFQGSSLALAHPQSPPPIGVALGSPTQAPPAWGRSHTADEINGMMARPAPPLRGQTTIPEERFAQAGAQPAIPELRKKESRWKTLGGLFGRKAKPAVQEPFYKVQISQALPAQQDWPAQLPQARQPHSPPMARPLVETPSPSPGITRSPGSISSHHSRTPSVHRGLARFEARAEADRHSFMPNIDSKVVPRTSSHVKRGSTSTPPQPSRPLETIRDSTDLFKVQQVDQERRDSPISTTSEGVGAQPKTPRLDLDIPGGEMERYSVMFEKLLEPRQSILERRQSKAKRQRSVSKKDLPAIPTPNSSCGPSPIEMIAVPALPPGPLPQRSATSPHLKRVPSLSISVKSKKSLGDLRRAPTQHQDKERPSTAIHRPRPIKRSKTAPPGSVSPVAPNFSRPKIPGFASSAEALTPDSPLLGEDSLPPTPTTIGTVADDARVAVRSSEPLPHNRTRPRQHNDSVDEQSWDMLTSKPAEIVSPRQDAYPRIKTTADLERQIVQVSVARQVSVSKARKLVQRAQVESKQQGLKPRVVEMKGRGDRKSTVVLIEGSDE